MNKSPFETHTDCQTKPLTQPGHQSMSFSNETTPNLDHQWYQTLEDWSLLVKQINQYMNQQITINWSIHVPKGFLIPTLLYWQRDESTNYFCWLQWSSSVYCKALFSLLLGWLGNNSYPGEDGAKSSFAFWSEGRQFNWKCKLRSHVSP